MNPCVRLAYNPGPVNTYRAFDALGGWGSLMFDLHSTQKEIEP